LILKDSYEKKKRIDERSAEKKFVDKEIEIFENKPWIFGDMFQIYFC